MRGVSTGRDRGLFVVIEGPDGSGKSTLAPALAERIRSEGHAVVAVRQPGGTPVAEAARRVFLDPELEASDLAELFLVLAARADLVDKIIAPALEAGKVVVSDRFNDSTIAYQVVGRGLPEKPVREALDLASSGLRPDILLVLDLPPEEGLRRQEDAGKVPDRLELAGKELHRKVARFFETLEGDSIFHIDADRDPDAVLKEAWRIVSEHLGKGVS